MIPQGWIDEQNRLIQLIQKASSEADLAFKIWCQKSEKRDSLNAKWNDLFIKPWPPTDTGSVT